ncbi:hypothetical protein [Arsenicibacter rosenii]|uniref:Uncharacterized protein n=1 Tax=Arsenicibacter rosenii TaxID=1750698 RepID=A0A1S2VQ76_9BACT|nr:hypothetical protein [Arsenicibacter rosenii]OIN60933.1 hypothetical protein BLX24_02275 [Arsenicibacter rosenii]
MRYIKDIPDPRFKVGLYAWNNKYIVKIEAGQFEQTYKISEMDLTEPEDVPAMLDTLFLNQVAAQFEAMQSAWVSAAERQGIF